MDKIVKQVVGIADGIIVGIDQQINMFLAFLNAISHGLIHFKFLGILVNIAWTVTGAGMQNDEHLVFLTRHDALTESGKEKSVIASVHLRIELGKFLVGQILVDMNGWLAPVVGAPRHVNTHAEGIVGQEFIEVVAILGFQNSLGTSSSIGSTRIGLEHLQIFLVRQQRIGVALVSVELEIGLACRFADDEHHNRFLMVGNLAVGQFYFLSLFIMLTAYHATDIYHIRPRLQ